MTDPQMIGMVRPGWGSPRRH